MLPKSWSADALQNSELRKPVFPLVI